MQALRDLMAFFQMGDGAGSFEEQSPEAESPSSHSEPHHASTAPAAHAAQIPDHREAQSPTSAWHGGRSSPSVRKAPGNGGGSPHSHDYRSF